jgi:hypothetical protein
MAIAVLAAAAPWAAGGAPGVLVDGFETGDTREWWRGVADGEVAMVFRDPAPFGSINSFSCTADVEVPVSVYDSCSEPIVAADVDLGDDGAADGPVDAIGGLLPDLLIGGEYPIGRHALLVSATSLCVGEVEARIPFEVADVKAPSPICINGLAVELMPVSPPSDVDGDGDLDEGAMTVWATDFIASPVSDCSEPVTYSLNRPTQDPDPDAAGLVVTCDDLPDGFVVVRVVGWDAVGNHDYCETYVLVQDSGGWCD